MIDEVKLYSRGLTADEVKKPMSGEGKAVVESAGKLTTMWGSMKSDVEK